MSLEEEKDFDVLPVCEYKEEIVSSIKQHQIIICVGETGSGKTTQIPQYCVDANLTKDKCIAITQPRRVAAITVAERVAEERKGRIGEEVGYVVRFDDSTGPRTKMKFMTDGVLVRECLTDPLLSAYGVVMLDEAHERSIHTDILFGLIKSACAKRSDLKVVITSATLDTVKFSAFFNSCPVIHVPGRMFPVDVYHSKTRQVMTTTGPATSSYVEATVDVVMKIHRKHQGEENVGHILVFLTGQEEIERACSLIRTAVAEDDSLNKEEGVEGGVTPLKVLPLYASLPAAAQKAVFKKYSVNGADDDGKGASSSTGLLPTAGTVRKCVIATNIAETSITVPHVRYVVDCGYVKQKTYDPVRHMESLIVVPISQVGAMQRAGRAGRTGPGSCYRLYATDCFQNMLPETVPEIKRSNLSNTVLYLKVLGIMDVIGFDFLEKPSVEQLEEALRLLNMLEAIDSRGCVTAIGSDMSNFPLEPTISRMLIQATHRDYDCASEMAIIAAMLSVENIWASPPRATAGRGQHGDSSSSNNSNKHRLEDMERAHAALRSPMGDHITYLNVFENWEKSGHSSRWCEENYVNFRAMKTAKNIRGQLKGELDKLNNGRSRNKGSFHSSNDRNVSDREGLEQRSTGRSHKKTRMICKSITSGLYMNAARKCSNDTVFRSLPLNSSEEVRLFHLHPSSSMVYTPSPEYIVYQEMVHSSKLFMRHVTCVLYEWCEEFSKQYSVQSVESLCGKSEIVENRKKINDVAGSVATMDMDRNSSGKRARSSMEATAESQNVAPGVSDAPARNAKAEMVSEAKARYLARKSNKR